MKIRFPTDRRATWREHFLAVARQAQSAGQRSQDLAAGSQRMRPRLAHGAANRVRALGATA